MKVPIVEIFSSIQGEGILIGRRQIFVRFAGCNLECSYCDTPNSQSNDFGELLDIKEILDIIEKLKTPDLHSISFTGGEPLLYVDAINEIVKKTNIKSLLETNGTLPNKLKELNKIDYVSLDIKLPEHFNNSWNEDIFDNEIKSLKLLTETDITVYCKIAALPSTKVETLEMIGKRISNELNNKNISLVIQPVSPIENWKNKDLLFKFSETLSKYFDVLIIPQIHKFLNIR